MLNFRQNLFAFPTTDVLDWNTRCFSNDIVGNAFVIKVVCDFKSLCVLTIQERPLFFIKNISHTVNLVQKNFVGVLCQRYVFNDVFVKRCLISSVKSSGSNLQRKFPQKSNFINFANNNLQKSEDCKLRVTEYRAAR